MLKKRGQRVRGEVVSSLHYPILYYACSAGYLMEAKGQFSLASTGQLVGVGVLAAVNLVRNTRELMGNSNRWAGLKRRRVPGSSPVFPRAFAITSSNDSNFSKLSNL